MRNVAPRHMTCSLLQCTELMNTPVSARFITAEGHYYRDFHNNVRQEQTLKVENQVFVDRLPQTTVASHAAYKTASSRNKQDFFNKRLDHTKYSAFNRIPERERRTAHQTRSPSRALHFHLHRGRCPTLHPKWSN